MGIGVGVSERGGGAGAVDEAGEAEGVGVTQFGGQGGVRIVLVADETREAVDGVGADGGGASVRERRVGAAVHDGVRDFDAGGEAVDDDASGDGFEAGDERGVLAEFGVGSVDGRGEVAVQGAEDGVDLALIGAPDDERARAEDFFLEGGVGDEGLGLVAKSVATARLGWPLDLPWAITLTPLWAVRAARPFW